jgi:hypothetical protein
MHAAIWYFCWIRKTSFTQLLRAISLATFDHQLWLKSPVRLALADRAAVGSVELIASDGVGQYNLLSIHLPVYMSHERPTRRLHQVVVTRSKLILYLSGVRSANPTLLHEAQKVLQVI